MRLCFIYYRDVFRATVLRNRPAGAEYFWEGPGRNFWFGSGSDCGNKTELKTFLNVYFKAIEARMLKNLIIIVTTF